MTNLINILPPWPLPAGWLAEPTAVARCGSSSTQLIIVHSWKINLVSFAISRFTVKSVSPALWYQTALAIQNISVKRIQAAISFDQAPSNTLLLVVMRSKDYSQEEEEEDRLQNNLGADLVRTERRPDHLYSWCWLIQSLTSGTLHQRTGGRPCWAWRGMCEPWRRWWLTWYRSGACWFPGPLILEWSVGGGEEDQYHVGEQQQLGEWHDMSWSRTELWYRSGMV